ncbi:MAG: M23 family metallopeptidase, partial [Acidimicrobiales bacterium]
SIPALLAMTSRARPSAARTAAAPAAEPGASSSAPGEANPTAGAAGPPGEAGAAVAKSADAQAAPGVVPAEAEAIIRSVRRSGPNSTKRLLAALAPLRDLGMSLPEIIAAGFGRFPVAGPTTFTHDWLFPRHTPEFHLHKGTDLFAAMGTPVRSPADGVLKLAQGGSGGLAAYVYQADGTYYYMAHLSAFATGQRPGRQVRLGEIVGYVGDSGNAKGGSPHVHFEIHPAPTRQVVTGKGRNRTVTYVVRPVPIGTVLPAMDPKATLDQWLKEALDAVPDLVAAVESRPRALVATGLTGRRGDGRPSSFAAPVAPPTSQLLWASSVNPGGGAARLAEAEALVVASEFDWSAAARRQEARREEQARALAWTHAVLAPLTPPALLTQTPASADE